MTAAPSLSTGDPSLLVLRPGGAEAGTGTRLGTRSGTGTRTGRPVVEVQGSKNCFNHLAPLALAGDDLQLQLDGTPSISDRDVVARILSDSGVDTLRVDDTLLSVGRPTIGTIAEDLGRRLRVSICYAAALAANVGEAVCPFPGGDAFTARPIDLHVSVLRAAGARCVPSQDGRWLSVAFARRPQAFRASLTTRFGPSMGASVTALLVAAQARGVSTLRGLCPEPEVVAVVDALRALGLGIESTDRDEVRVHGGDGPLRGSLRLTVPPDRTEAATYLLVGALRHPEAAVAGIAPHHLPAGLRHAFAAAGLHLRHERTADDRPLTVVRGGALGAVDLETGPHPAFPTDVQPQMAALLTQAAGTSSVTERVYAARVTHVPELSRLGLRVRVHGARQVVPGGQSARGGRATVHDIRCGAALLVAAAAADGPVVLHDPDEHLARGYADLPAKLATLGLDLSRTGAAVPSVVPAARTAGLAAR